MCKFPTIVHLVLLLNFMFNNALLRINEIAQFWEICVESQLLFDLNIFPKVSLIQAGGALICAVCFF